jgi:hypothetical protein
MIGATAKRKSGDRARFTITAADGSAWILTPVEPFGSPIAVDVATLATDYSVSEPIWSPSQPDSHLVGWQRLAAAHLENEAACASSAPAPSPEDRFAALAAEG